MAPRIKLIIANVLMGIGVMPLALVVVWLAAYLGWMAGRRPAIPLPDPLAMIGLFVASFLLTGAIAGTAAAWSWDVVRAHPESRTRTALGLRLMTAAILASPFVLLFLAQFL